MIIQCAWCLKLLGEKEPLKDKDVTHSICDKCEEEMLIKAGVKKKEAA